MQISPGLHLTYCSNIHAGESWKEVFDALNENIPLIKEKLSLTKPFGIGLRLSDAAAKEMLSGGNLIKFRKWLAENDCYVFTLNGFPYGGFHNTVVKDNVYKPDWTTSERLIYTLNLIDVLSELIPESSEAGISTSPLSYKPWLNNSCNAIDVFEASAINLMKCVVELYRVRKYAGKYIHLDIEPEPSCLLESSKETIDFFNEYLIPYGRDYLKYSLNLPLEICESIIRDHITLCYDICHFSVEYEKPAEVIKAFQSAGIKVGKVQISSALKVITNKHNNRNEILNQYQLFSESVYLHQTIVKDALGLLHHFNDLPEALKHFYNPEFHEWRTHYHVPVFMLSYNELQSTQDDILEVLNILKKNKFTNHLEVETYTWEVLPKAERLELKESIIRELGWVINIIINEKNCSH
ncbi:MAG: metabolite traffic protein EboE [Chitinophagales bacterium]|nr:metabolite traffic protein EboE [Chitinophagales bacterium]